MKMRPDQYADIRAAMTRKLGEVPQAFAEYETAGLSRVRLAWDVLRASIGDKGICALYSYLNDTHIQTAILKIVNEYGVQS